MTRMKFPISSDHLELLLAFEQSSGLAHLAELMAKDPSVISRNLQRIAEDFPVLAKVNGRWELTPLGRQINLSTRDYLTQAQRQIGDKGKSASSIDPCHSPNALLVVINAQNGLLDRSLGQRNNSEAETNISKLLDKWRGTNKPVLHVKHISDNPESSFYRSSKGCEFLPSLEPKNKETVIEKKKASAFSDTRLKEYLESKDLDVLVLVGFTANDCIDATARHASDLGFTTYVVGDATAMFDISGTDGRLIKADRVHKLTLANLNALYAKVIETESLVGRGSCTV